MQVCEQTIRLLENCLASPHTVETEIEEKELIQLIEDFLKTLSVQNRVIFLRRYWFSDNYAEIAEEWHSKFQDRHRLHILLHPARCLEYCRIACDKSFHIYDPAL